MPQMDPTPVAEHMAFDAAIAPLASNRERVSEVPQRFLAVAHQAVPDAQVAEFMSFAGSQEFCQTHGLGAASARLARNGQGVLQALQRFVHTAEDAVHVSHSVQGSTLRAAVTSLPSQSQGNLEMLQRLDRKSV